MNVYVKQWIKLVKFGVKLTMDKINLNDDRPAWRMFSKIDNEKDLSKYLTREYEHTKYIHYTGLDAINNIMKDRQFWLCDVKGLNDKKDIQQFGNEVCFSLCFSTGVNENLSLWYLYSGIDGKGGSISFEKKKIKKLIQNGKYELWKFYGNDKQEKICDIENGKNAEIKFVDVLYANDKISVKKREEGKMALKYNTMTNYNISKKEFSKFKEKNIGNIKGLIWYYEKETRLIVKLSDAELKHMVNSSNKSYYNDCNGKVNYRVIFDFNHMSAKEFEIILAPGNADYREIEKCEYIKKYRDETSGISLSLYNGDVDFKLIDKMCETCERRNK